MALVIPAFIPHLGCPHDCLFCNQRKITGADYTASDPKDIPETIDTWLSRYRGSGPVEVAFYGGSFTCIKEEQQISLLEKVDPFIRNGKVDAIRCSTRPDCINEKIVDTLLKYHVRTVELGIQSLDDRVLQKAQRGHSAAQSRDAAMLLIRKGLHLGLQLMPGLPGDSRDSFLQTVREAIALRPKFVRIYPTLVITESGLERIYKRGEYKPLLLEQAVAIAAESCELFEEAGVEVARLGLQATESLEKDIVAGPYHPAFGELVHSRRWLKKILHQLRSLKKGERLTIMISHRDLSKVIGRCRENVKRLDGFGFEGRYTIEVDRAIPQGSVNYVINE